MQKRVKVDAKYFIYIEQEEVDLHPRNFFPIKGQHIEHITQRVHSVRSVGKVGTVQVCEEQG